jgi:hypothetical protein
MTCSCTQGSARHCRLRGVRSVAGGQSGCLRCHVVLRWNFHLNGNIYKQTFSWVSCYSLPCCTNNSFRTSRWATVTALGKIVWKIRMVPTETTVQVVCFAFTRTRRGRHIAESSVYARTKKKKRFLTSWKPYVLPEYLVFFLSFCFRTRISCFLKEPG